jgi:hypothetical protein
VVFERSGGLLILWPGEFYRLPRIRQVGMRLAKMSYTCRMNDLAKD